MITINIKLAKTIAIAFGLAIVVLASYALIFGNVSYLSSTYLG